MRAGYGGGPRDRGRPDGSGHPGVGGRRRRDRLLLRGQPSAGRDAQPLAGPRGGQAGVRRAARPASAGAGRRELRVRPRRDPQAPGGGAGPPVTPSVLGAARCGNDAFPGRDGRLRVQPPAPEHRDGAGKTGQPGGRRPVPAEPVRADERGRAERAGEQGRDLPGPAGAPVLLGTGTAPARTTTCKGGSAGGSTRTSSSP